MSENEYRRDTQIGSTMDFDAADVTRDHDLQKCERWTSLGNQLASAENTAHSLSEITAGRTQAQEKAITLMTKPSQLS